MASNDLMDRLAKGTVLLDGGMGTLLIENGLTPGTAPERFLLERPDVIGRCHGAYVEAGSDCILTSTFGGSRWKLDKVGVEPKSVNTGAVKAARAACGPTTILVGDLGPTGEFMKPYGTRSREEFVEVFSEQVGFLEGVEAFLLETNYSLEETLAGIEAIRTHGTASGSGDRVSSPPIIASMTFNETPAGFKTMMGEDVGTCVQRLEEAGASVVGSNCTIGSDSFLPLARDLVEHASVPVVVQPNAGAPVAQGSEVIYPVGPEDFARQVMEMVDLGVRMVGGCCGTTPAHVSALRELIDGRGA